MKTFLHEGICPIRDILSRLGDKWSLLVLTTLYSNGTMRFNDIQRSLGDISQPVQWVMSGVMGTPLSLVHSAAVFSRRALSFVTVAILASPLSQSSPQQPISWFVFFIVVSISWNL